MPRLQENLLGRVENLADRVIAVANALEESRVSKRIVDQLIGCGTAVGANVFEADEAMSRADFVKCLCIANKELNETRFWLRLAARNQWLPATRLGPLTTEASELKKVFGSIISRSKKRQQR